MKIICALFDKKAGEYMQPMFVPALGIAYRSLSDEIARGGEGNVLAPHHEDFQLWQLGLFDTETGVIVSDGCPKMICEVSTLVLK